MSEFPPPGLLTTQGCLQLRVVYETGFYQYLSKFFYHKQVLPPLKKFCNTAEYSPLRVFWQEYFEQELENMKQNVLIPLTAPGTVSSSSTKAFFHVPRG